MQRLERGAGHGDERRRAQLQGEHAGAEVERRGRGPGRASRENASVPFVSATQNEW